MPTTYPNQKTVRVHREQLTGDFLGIKNENWQAAARDLSPHTMMLYFYLAANADNYSLALSPAAIRQTIGMARSTYNDQLQRLIDKGYLVHSHGNKYDFYEVPQRMKKDTALVNDSTAFENDSTEAVKSSAAENREINNKEKDMKNIETDIVVPEVREIVIKRPTAEPKKHIPPKPMKKEFIF